MNPKFPMVKPDYLGNSLVNLMVSVGQGLGRDATGYAPLALLSDLDLSAFRNVVFILVDGLGDSLLQTVGRGSVLNALRQGRLTSVTPSTTASAVTTVMTGLAPQQHGLTGWHMFFRELGAILAVLPGRARYGGVGLAEAGIDVAAFFNHPSFFDGWAGKSVVFSPKAIEGSAFNRVHVGSAESRGYSNLSAFFEGMRANLSTDETRRLVYGYWSDLDHIAHESGSLSIAWADAFEAFDLGFSRFLESMAGTDTLVLVTADHGFVDLSPGDTLDLDDFKTIRECLSMPLCGEGRLAYAYVRPHLTDRFEERIRQELGDTVHLVPSQVMVDGGWFGLGAPHPELLGRVGDYCLLMRQPLIVRDYLPFERRHRMIGVHGGVSPDEMWVPLIVADARN